MATDHQKALHCLLIVVVTQAFIIAYLISPVTREPKRSQTTELPPALLYNNKNGIRLEERNDSQVFQVNPAMMAPLKPSPFQEDTGKHIVEHKLNQPIRVEIAKSNLPFKQDYSNGTTSFEKKFGMPSSLIGWTPEVTSYTAFQPVDQSDLWIYSAYFDNTYALPRPASPMVRVFGLKRSSLPVTSLICYLHLKRGDPSKMVAVRARTYILPDNHLTPVRPVSLECRYKRGLRPIAVSFSLGPHQVLTNQLDIQFPVERRRNFTVCYSVLHSSFNQTDQLVQSIELNKILGAEHFMLYNLSISPQTDHVLRHYQKQGILTVLQWPLPTIETWYFGQMAAINDCIYRNRAISQFVVVVDTDEFIIPRQTNTWMSMIRSLDSGQGWTSTPQLTQGQNQSKIEPSPTNGSRPQTVISSFVFRSTFFFPKGKITELTSSGHVPVLDDVYRNQYIQTHKTRSKTILRPDLIHTGGIHYVFYQTNHSIPAYVDWDQAVVHHYREGSDMRNVEKDTIVLKYRDSLVKAMAITFSELHLYN